MKVLLDRDFCIGDGTCSILCPEIFVINDDVAMSLIGADEDVPVELEERCREAAESCPVMAVILRESGDVRFHDLCGAERLNYRSSCFPDPSPLLDPTGAGLDIRSDGGSVSRVQPKGFLE